MKCVAWVNREVDFEVELGLQGVYGREKEYHAREWLRREEGGMGKASFQTEF